MVTRDDQIAAVTKVLRDEGEPHDSWRCQYPDLYGPCHCLEQMAALIVDALPDASALQAQIAGLDAEVGRLRAVVESIRTASVVSHKGPHDTDTAMMRRAAWNLRRGYEVGGSNVKGAVARVLIVVADALDGSHE